MCGDRYIPTCVCLCVCIYIHTYIPTKYPTESNSGMSFFLRNYIFCQSYLHFLFKVLWKNNLRPLSGCSYLFSGLSRGSCSPVPSSELSAAVFTRELLDGHRGHLQTCLQPQVEYSKFLGAGAVHSPGNSSWVTPFPATASSSFSISSAPL